MPTQIITASMLVRARACHDQLVLFRKTFPRGCRVTISNVQKALNVGLDVDWAVDNFASPRAWDAYKAAVKPHRDAFNAAIKPLWDAYKAATKPHIVDALLDD